MIAAQTSDGTPVSVETSYVRPPFLQDLPNVTAGSVESVLDSGDQCSANVPQPNVNFEGIENVFGDLPPDPVGDVGPNHYVQMVNFGMAVFDKKKGTRLLFLPLSQIWSGFPITDCALNNGDPIVLHDQFEDRWILTQLTIGCLFGDVACYNCIAVSKTPDPTGVYYRYAFKAYQEPNVGGRTSAPDSPKYGVWSNSYILTTRSVGAFGISVGIGVYALEKEAMIAGNATARAVQFVIPDIPLTGSFGLLMLPPDIDGPELPPAGKPAPIISLMNDDYNDIIISLMNDDYNDIDMYPVPYEGLNFWELDVDWTTPSTASLVLNTPQTRFAQLPSTGGSLVPLNTTTAFLSQVSSLNNTLTCYHTI
jgi:hypothetical protein